MWASLALDDEIAELELVALRAHLGSCPECASFAASIAAATDSLRASPLAPGRPVALPRLGASASRRLLLGTAAAAVAAAVAVGALVGSLTRAGSTPERAHPSPAAIAQTQEPYLEQSLLAMLVHLRPPTGRTVAV